MGRQAAWGVVGVVCVAAACTAARDGLRSGEAWADAAPIVYPAQPEELQTQLQKLLSLWEFRFGPEASDAAVLNIYDRGEPVALENLGIVVGVDRTELSGDEPPDLKFQAETGYLVGAVVEFALTRDVLLSIQPSYVHTKTGVAYKDKKAGVLRDSLALDVDWLVLPVVARIKANDGALYATGGVDFAWAMGGGLSGGTVDEPADSFIRDMEVSAVIGVGLEFPVGRNHITAELRYRQGLLNAAQDDIADNGLPRRFRFAGIQLTAGFLFSLGGP